MEKIFTVEVNAHSETVELHLNREGAKYLRDLLDKLIATNQEEHFHLLTPNWGGVDLTGNKQNRSDDVHLINQLKIMYWV